MQDSNPNGERGNEMKTFLECYPCVLRHALDSARVATGDEIKQRAILNSVMAFLQELPAEATPPEIAQSVHRFIRKTTGHPDPYEEKKKRQNEQALSLVPACEKWIAEASDPLAVAARLAAAGNVIDLGGLAHEYDLEAELKAVLTADFGVWEYERFKQDAIRSRSILYLGDNTGEIVFDRLLVQALQNVTSAKIIFVVRGGPVLNDATLDAARFVGLDRIIRVMGNGSDAPGTLLSEVSHEVREHFKKADMIISKGQGNYETLNEAPGNIYFLLKVKCPVVARETAAKQGTYLLARSLDSRSRV